MLISILEGIWQKCLSINIPVEGKNYTVIRKVENMKKTYSYTGDTVMIHEIEVPAFYRSITGYKLVSLKDEIETVKLFIYA